MLMDAPPSGEKPAEFIQVTDYLKQLGARVPRIVASDPEQGFILLESLVHTQDSHFSGSVSSVDPRVGKSRRRPAASGKNLTADFGSKFLC